MARTRSVDFLPQIFQTPVNKQFLAATLDQMVQEPKFKKTQGFIGRTVGPGVNPNDKYVVEPDKSRQDYQLEPGVISLEPDTSNIRNVITYPGINDAIGFQGGDQTRPDQLYNSEYYTWDPFVNYDSFVNFSQYFWVPTGPQTVEINTGGIPATDDFTVTRENGVYTFSGVPGNNPTLDLVRGGNYTFQVAQNAKETVNYRVTNSGTSSYLIDQLPNPTLTLARGNTYVFNLTLSAPYPFWIKTAIVQGTGSTYNSGVTRNGSVTGLVTFTVPQDAPDTLYYVAENQTNLQGTFNIVNSASGTGPGFWIQTNPGTAGVLPYTPNISSRDVVGVVNNGEDLGVVSFNVPQRTAQQFYYDLADVGPIDLATTLEFDQINNQPLNDFIAQTGGIDGITYPDARFPILTKEGLLFNSNKNGVQNLYLANNHMTEARPVSHTLTGMYMADMDPSQKEILATAMTSNGFNIASIDKKDWHATAKSLPHVNSLLGDRYTDSAPNKNNSYKLSATSAEFSEYSAAGYLWPQYWIPFVAGSTSQNGIVVQASTSGFDPLKKHSYSLIASWDSDINKASVAGSYLNQTTSLPFAISTTQRNSYLGDISNEYSDFTILGAVLPDTFKLSRYSNLQVGWQFTERSTSVRSLKRTGPMSIISYKDYSQAASKISPDSGMGGYFGVFDFIPQDNFLSHWQFWLGGEKYFHKYLPKNHAVMIRAKGIYTPEKISALYGASTDSMVFIPDNPLPEYIQRGYQRGQIYGRNLINVNLEYRFPIMNIYRGSGTDPIFMRRISGAIIADSTAADGVFIDPIQGIAESINSHRWFSSAGVEAKVETTLGYVFPINFVIGYYQAFNTYNGSESVISTSIQISGF